MTTGTGTGERTLAQLVHGTLERNWREGERGAVQYAYTDPSPGRYPWQWYWDSCFAAIAWRRFDPRRSRAELETLLAAAEPDGFIGHTIFWSRPVTLRRYLFYNVTSRDALDDAHDAAAGDGVRVEPRGRRPARGFAARASPRVVHARARSRRRRPAVGAAARRDGHGRLAAVRPGLGHARPGAPLFPLLVWRNRRLGFDIRAVRDAGGPILCSVLTNVLHGLSRLALGQPSITPALVARLWDERAGLFRNESWPASPPAPVTWAALSPLALPDLPEAIGRRLVEEHLLDPARFWLAVPPPSVAADEPSFSLRDRRFGLRRYWRGPTWINSAWLLWMGLVRLGYAEQARELAARVTGAVMREGLREYYNPYTGTGMGVRDFAWSALALELLDDRAGDGEQPRR